MVVLATAIVSLNGNWNLKGWPTPRRGSVRTLDAVPAAEVSVPATVPGCYELDLCAAGLLPNLFYANNHYSVRKYEGHQWLYARKFTMAKVPADETAILVFDGLDTLCDVFLNGQKVGEAEDMFIPHAFDVSKAVREGENEVAVLFRAGCRSAVQGHRAHREREPELWLRTGRIPQACAHEGLGHPAAVHFRRHLPRRAARCASGGRIGSAASRLRLLFPLTA